MEQKIINNFQSFLLELGKGFTFVGRQSVLLGNVQLTSQNLSMISILNDKDYLKGLNNAVLASEHQEFIHYGKVATEGKELRTISCIL